MEDFSKDSQTKTGLRRVCRKCDSENNKAYYAANSEDVCNRTAQHYAKNPEKKRESGAKYFQENKEKLNIIRAKYQYMRRKYDALYKLSSNIRSLILGAFKKHDIKKNTKTAEILGCTWEEFMFHIESLF